MKRSDIEIDGKECVIIGRSNIVGKPMSMLLLRENGTVTICHSHTKDLKKVTKRADILIVAIGKTKFVTADYIKEGLLLLMLEWTEMRTGNSVEMLIMQM